MLDHDDYTETIDIVYTRNRVLSELNDDISFFQNRESGASLDGTGEDRCKMGKVSDGKEGSDRREGFFIYRLIAVLIVVGLVGLSLLDGSFEWNSAVSDTSSSHSLEDGSTEINVVQDEGYQTTNSDNTSVGDKDGELTQSMEDSAIYAENDEMNSDSDLRDDSSSCEFRYFITYLVLGMGFTLFAPSFLCSLTKSTGKFVEKSDRVTQVICSIGISLVIVETFVCHIDFEEGHIWSKLFFAFILVLNTEMVFSEYEKITIIVRNIAQSVKRRGIKFFRKKDEKAFSKGETKGREDRTREILMNMKSIPLQDALITKILEIDDEEIENYMQEPLDSRNPDV